MRLTAIAKAFLPAKATLLLRSIKNESRRIKYFRTLKQLKPQSLSAESQTAHMLLVKNDKYVDVGKICALSFLKFHPKSKIEIHIDSFTQKRAKKVFAHEIANDLVELKFQGNENQTWQEMKITLICSLSFPNHFYMDADLRWNGPLQLTTNPTFFVPEFIIGTNSNYQKAFKEMNLTWINECEMKNTSFFSWGNLRNDSSLKESITSNFYLLMTSLSGTNLAADVKRQLERLAEQIAFSATLSRDFHNVHFLKSTDGQMDGSFLESSYYGATGTSF